ncbi:hypothetical protein PVAG01_09141 [Phlyctema vagabunda]|uniref:Uncharacterized protein n=1 Tax=Phlyctema vagabunda TaxID=108571 RepID=A0ABR4P6J2_9HELO
MTSGLQWLTLEIRLVFAKPLSTMTLSTLKIGVLKKGSMSTDATTEVTLQDNPFVDAKYTGRTPLHLAVMASTAEIVQCLVDHGARLIARLVDGRTALHIAAARGNADMVKILMNRSLANEEEEDLKQDARRASKASAKNTNDDGMDTDPSDSDSEASEITLGSDSDTDSVTMGSFVKVDTEKQKNADVRTISIPLHLHP